MPGTFSSGEHVKYSVGIVSPVVSRNQQNKEIQVIRSFRKNILKLFLSSDLFIKTCLCVN